MSINFAVQRMDFENMVVIDTVAIGRVAMDTVAVAMDTIGRVVIDTAMIGTGENKIGSSGEIGKAGTDLQMVRVTWLDLSVLTPATLGVR